MIYEDQLHSAALLAGLYVFAHVLKGEEVSIETAAEYAAKQLRVLNLHIGRPARNVRAKVAKVAQLEQQLAILQAPGSTLKDVRQKRRKL